MVRNTNARWFDPEYIKLRMDKDKPPPLRQTICGMDVERVVVKNVPGSSGAESTSTVTIKKMPWKGVLKNEC